MIQDYFTKWVDTIPLPASHIAAELIKLFSTYGPPQILHNFESALFTQFLHAFGVRKSRTTPNHPQGDGMEERFNRTLLEHMWTHRVITCCMCCMLIEHPNTHNRSFSISAVVWQHPSPCPMASQLGYDCHSYPAQIQASLVEL